MDEHWVEKTDRLFNGDQVSASFSYRRAEIDEQVRKASDNDVLEADTESWSRPLAAEHEMEAPVIDLEAATLSNLGRVEVNCTDAPGIRMTSGEMYGRVPVYRPGYRFELRVPLSGTAELLRSAVPGTHPLLAAIREGHISRIWEWPDELGAKSFEREVNESKGLLKRSVEAVAAAVRAENETLVEYAKTAIEARREEILREQEFLGNLTIPVNPADDAPQEFGPPPIVRVETPAQNIGAPETEPKPTTLEPQLDEFYDHILSLIRTVGRSLERTPGSFAAAEEENLRDLTLVTLNTHYRGATYAEAFNGSGKTDILIRVYDHNAFIGECKWWSGAKALDDALVQLFAYLTARDTRAALIFYVSNKELTTTIEAARQALEAREEFIEWLQPDDDFELKCRMRSPDDETRVVTLAAMFVHLPKS